MTLKREDTLTIKAIAAICRAAAVPVNPVILSNKSLVAAHPAK